MTHGLGSQLTHMPRISRVVALSGGPAALARLLSVLMLKVVAPGSAADRHVASRHACGAGVRSWRGQRALPCRARSSQVTAMGLVRDQPKAMARTGYDLPGSV